MLFYDGYGNEITVGGDSSNPLVGKKICLIGDSNFQYSGNIFKTYLEDTYSCNVTILATAGYCWEYTGSSVSSASEVTDPSGIGRINQIVNAAVDTLITEYDVIAIMLGTNLHSLGELTDTASSYTTMCGAMRYCMEKLCYYGRKIKIGVIIPISSDTNYQASATLREMPTKFEYVKEIARQYAVPVLDMWNESRVIPNSFTPSGSNYYLGDSVHLGANGNIQFEERLGKWLAFEL